MLFFLFFFKPSSCSLFTLGGVGKSKKDQQTLALLLLLPHGQLPSRLVT